MFPASGTSLAMSVRRRGVGPFFVFVSCERTHGWFGLSFPPVLHVYLGLSAPTCLVGKVDGEILVFCQKPFGFDRHPFSLLVK